jgi:hypothetical protein
MFPEKRRKIACWRGLASKREVEAARGAAKETRGD